VFNKNVRGTLGREVRGTSKVEREVHGTRKVEKHCPNECCVGHNEMVLFVCQFYEMMLFS
jgi:hypothetical protein